MVKWSEMKMEMVLVMGMMVMMISMMLVTMVMTMRTISPSERSFPRQNLPAGKVFSSLVVSASLRRRNF